MNMTVMTLRSHEEVRALRKSAGLTQAELASRLQVDRGTVNRWECGRRPIPKIARVAIRLVCQEKARLDHREAG